MSRQNYVLADRGAETDMHQSASRVDLDNRTSPSRQQNQRNRSISSRQSISPSNTKGGIASGKLQGGKAVPTYISRWQEAALNQRDDIVGASSQASSLGEQHQPIQEHEAHSTSHKWRSPSAMRQGGIEETPKPSRHSSTSSPKFPSFGSRLSSDGLGMARLDPKVFVPKKRAA